MKNSPSTILEQKKGRRGMLALIGAGGAAAVAALFSRNGSAEAGHDATNVFHLGEDNTAIPGATTIRTADVDDAALAGVNTNSGEFPIGVGGIASTAPASTAQIQGLDRTLKDRRSQAKSKMLATVAAARQGDVVIQQEVGNGSGVVGLGDLSGVLGASDGGFGVFGFDDILVGVAGVSGSGIGVVGTSTSGPGMRGTGKPGVHGISSNGAGVRGEGKAGVHGIGNGAAGSMGVRASNIPSRLSLRTEGRVRMNCARKVKLSNRDNVVKLPPAVKAASTAIVMAMVQGASGNGAFLRRAFRVDSTHVRLIFDKKPGRATVVGYWVVHTG